MLCQMPLEIMNKIFGHLDLPDQLHLAQSSEHLGRVFAFYASVEYKHLECSKFTDEDSLAAFLQLCGSKVLQIDIKDKLTENTQGINPNIYEQIMKYCINLESAILEVTQENFNVTKPILLLKGLKSIKLYIWNYRGTDLLHYINPECRMLTVFNATEDQARQVRHLIHLEEVKFAMFIRFSSILEICSGLKELRILEVFFCPRLLYPPAQELVYPELEKLVIRNIGIVSKLPSCPKLKCLALIPVSVPVQIIEKYASTLNSLEMYAHPSEKNPVEMFLQILKKCKNVQFCSTNTVIVIPLFSKFLASFMAILRENGFNSDRTFVLKVNDCTDQQIEEWVNKIPNCKVLDIVNLK